jgi:hypothetical protein
VGSGVALRALTRLCLGVNIVHMHRDNRCICTGTTMPSTVKQVGAVCVVLALSLSMQWCALLGLAYHAQGRQPKDPLAGGCCVVYYRCRGGAPLLWVTPDRDDITRTQASA